MSSGASKGKAGSTTGKESQRHASASRDFLPSVGTVLLVAIPFTLLAMAKYGAGAAPLDALLVFLTGPFTLLFFGAMDRYKVLRKGSENKNKAKNGHRSKSESRNRSKITFSRPLLRIVSECLLVLACFVIVTWWNACVWFSPSDASAYAHETSMVFARFFRDATRYWNAGIVSVLVLISVIRALRTWWETRGRTLMPLGEASWWLSRLVSSVLVPLVLMWLVFASAAAVSIASGDSLVSPWFDGGWLDGAWAIWDQAWDHGLCWGILAILAVRIIRERILLGIREGSRGSIGKTFRTSLRSTGTKERAKEGTGQSHGIGGTHKASATVFLFAASAASVLGVVVATLSVISLIEGNGTTVMGLLSGMMVAFSVTGTAVPLVIAVACAALYGSVTRVRENCGAGVRDGAGNALLGLSWLSAGISALTVVLDWDSATSSGIVSWLGSLGSSIVASIVANYETSPWAFAANVICSIGLIGLAVCSVSLVLWAFGMFLTIDADAIGDAVFGTGDGRPATARVPANLLGSRAVLVRGGRMDVVLEADGNGRRRVRPAEVWRDGAGNAYALTYGGRLYYVLGQVSGIEGEGGVYVLL